MAEVHTFCHKVGRKVALEELLVLKGVVQLAVGHAATLKPAVKHLLHSMQVPLALLAGNSDVINEVPVQISHLQSHGHIFPVPFSVPVSVPFSTKTSPKPVQRATLTKTQSP